jgi:hypothetical protein
VKAGEELLEHLAMIGFDVKYGARPLKRAMERELLAPLAKQINRHAGDVPLTAELGVAEGRPTIAVRPIQGPRAQVAQDAAGPGGQLARKAQDLRRWHQLLEVSSIVRQIENDIHQLSNLEKHILARQAMGKPARATDAETLARLGRLRELHGLLRKNRDDVVQLEDEALIGFYAGEAGHVPELEERRNALSRDWDDLLYRLYAVNQPDADGVTLLVNSEHRGHLIELAEAYRIQAQNYRLKCQMAAYVPLLGNEARAAMAKGRPAFAAGLDIATEWLENVLYEKDGAAVRAVLRRKPLASGPVDGSVPENAVALALAITGPAADVRFSSEHGLHVFVPAPADQGNPNVYVGISAQSLKDYCPPLEIVRKGSIIFESPRRTYDPARGAINDRLLEKQFANVWGNLATVLGPIIEETVRLRLRQLVLE